MNHEGTKRIETDRLILRQFVLEDSEDVYRNWANDDEVTKFLTWPTHPDTEVSAKVIKSWVEEYSKPDFYQWAIELKSMNEVIGSISAVRINEEINSVEIGYCIGRKFWKQGITSDALNALIKFFFEEVKVNRIEAKHDPNNPNSGRVMMKCGLKLEGTCRKASKNNLGICDISIYGILADDYYI
jgi:ribosomal-protein-alanine N-acetyltransferase